MNPQVDKLAEKIVQASFKYYQGEDLLMTDKQFDAALDKLKSIDPSHWVLKTPGWGFCDSDAKINHLGKNKVGSLNKIKYPEPLEEFDDYLISPKFDGLSVVVYAQKGKIVALTRNNGVVGKDVTHNVLHLLQEKTKEDLIKHPGLFAVRGEVIVPGFSGETVRQEHNLPLGAGALRNFAAGVVNRKEPSEDLKYLDFVPYFIRIDTHRKYLNQTQMLAMLKDMGFTECPDFSITTVGDNKNQERLLQIFDVWKELYPIDGLVISVNPHMYQVDVDFTEFESKSIAYKFESERAEAIVGDVKWTTGSAGRLAPTVALENPIELSGASIQNVSAHHAEYVKEFGIGKGALVEITRANEVIPYITEVKSAVEGVVPANCPSCLKNVEWQGTYLVCTNKECPAVLKSSIYKFFNVVGIPEGLSSSTLDKWLFEFPALGDVDVRIDSLIELLQHYSQSGPKNVQTRKNRLIKKFGNHFGALLQKFEINIDKKLSEGITYDEFWFMLNLPQLGKANSKKLFNFNPETVNFWSVEDEVKSLGVTAPAAKAIKENAEHWNRICKVFSKFLKPGENEKESVPEGPLSGMKVCFTGVRLKGDDKEKFKNSGAKEVGSVNKETTHLVAKDPNSNSGKAKKAKDLGIVVWSLDQLFKEMTL